MTPIIFWTLLIASCGFALVRGGNDERLAAMVCIGASLLTLLIHDFSSVSYVGVQLGDMSVDVAVLAAFVAIALRSSRFWPLWVSGLSLTTIVGHAMKFADQSLFPHAYAAAVRLWSYPIVLIIGVAAWRSARRKESQPTA